jgi:glyoxylase I family protein
VTGSLLRDELLRLESALASRDATGVDGGLDRLIADDLLEIGASGRRWSAADIRPLLATAPAASVMIEDFEVAPLSTDVVLATYRIAGSRPTARSSIWVRRDGRWVMRFHQGTPRTA